MNKLSNQMNNQSGAKRGTRNLRRISRAKSNSLPSTKRRESLRTRVEKGLVTFDHILVKIAVSALLVYEVVSFVSGKTF